jgi:hypothetical protein
MLEAEPRRSRPRAAGWPTAAAARSSPRRRRSAAAPCRCSSCRGRRWRSTHGLASRLRAGRPAAVGRIADGRLLLDVRTLSDEEADRRPPPSAPRGDDDRAPLTLGTPAKSITARPRSSRADRQGHRPPARREGARISIELGYAPLRLASGRRLSVVDAPGHERFVRTMVAGAPASTSTSWSSPPTTV